MASPPSLRISPEIRSGPTDLFMPIALILLLNFDVRGEWVAYVFTLYIGNIILASKYRWIIAVKGVGFFYRVCNDPSVAGLDGGNIFPIPSTPSYEF
jgi:hypothetical protein